MAGEASSRFYISAEAEARPPTPLPPAIPSPSPQIVPFPFTSMLPQRPLWQISSSQSTFPQDSKLILNVVSTAPLLSLQSPDTVSNPFNRSPISESLTFQDTPAFSAAAVQSPVMYSQPSVFSQEVENASDRASDVLSGRTDSADTHPVSKRDEIAEHMQPSGSQIAEHDVKNAAHLLSFGAKIAEPQTLQEKSDSVANIGGTHRKSDISTGAAAQQFYPAQLASHEQVMADGMLFMETLTKFHEALGTHLRLPQIGGKDLDLQLLYREVTAHGGVRQVIKERKWKDIVATFGLPTRIPYPAYVLRKLYTSLLHHFEQVYFFGAQGQLVPPPDFLPTPSPAPSSLAYDVFTYPPSEDSEPANKRKRRKKLDSASVPGADPAATVGNVVTGAIEGKFEHGYFVTMMVGAEKLKGVLYHVPSTIDARQFAVIPELLTNTNVPFTRPSLKVFPRQGKQPRRKREIRRKDPNAPRPFKTGYNFFYIEQRQRLKALYPDKERELSKVIGGIWNRLSEEERRPYLESGQRDKERYTKESFEYNEKMKLLANLKGNDFEDSKGAVQEHTEVEKKMAQDPDFDYATVMYHSMEDRVVDISGFNLPQEQPLNSQMSGRSAGQKLMNYHQDHATDTQNDDVQKVKLLPNLNGDYFEAPKEDVCEPTKIERKMEHDPPELNYATATDCVSMERDVDMSGFNLPQEQLLNAQLCGQSELLNYNQKYVTHSQNDDFQKVKLLTNLNEDNFEAPKNASWEHTEIGEKASRHPNQNYATAAHLVLLNRDVDTTSFDLPQEQLKNNQLSGQFAVQELVIHDQKQATDSQKYDFQKVKLLVNLKGDNFEAPKDAVCGQTKVERQTSQYLDLNHATATYPVSRDRDLAASGLNILQEQLSNNQLFGQSPAQELMTYDQEQAVDSENDDNLKQKAEYEENRISNQALSSQVNVHTVVGESLRHGDSAVSNITRLELDDTASVAKIKEGMDVSDGALAYQFSCDFTSPQEEVCINQIFNEYVKQEAVNYDQVNAIHGALEQDEPQDRSFLNVADTSQTYAIFVAAEKMDLTHNVLPDMPRTPEVVVQDEYDVEEHEAKVVQEVDANENRHHASLDEVAVVSGPNNSHEQLGMDRGFSESTSDKLDNDQEQSYAADDNTSEQRGQHQDMGKSDQEHFTALEEFVRVENVEHGLTVTAQPVDEVSDH
ncbi:hypothetical protein O6H91_04G024300 [Diphasiastrum complanatum]|uniref:Uncharacterized protein n=1 Tax=Diphasiastrum complanatum TaxID=34168 RepID=A0ACC2DUZ8_DIPCM|nr:hypothetical protein O6H91_04G024300 [Diphasiastrum complanatum]